MKSRYKYSLGIEVEGASAILEGKMWYSLSSNNRSSDLFFDTELGIVNCNVILLNRTIILIRRGESPLRATGKSLLKRIYLSPEVMTLFIDDFPVTLSLRENPSCVPSLKFTDRALLFLAALCLLSSLLPGSFAGKRIELYLPPLYITEGISPTLMKKQAITKAVCYSRLDEFALSSQATGIDELLSLHRALHLSRMMYEAMGNDKESRVIGRMIGGFSRRLHDVENMK